MKYFWFPGTTGQLGQKPSVEIPNYLNMDKEFEEVEKKIHRDKTFSLS
jgi:hypothetical protein